jgi:2-dehydropantoate 2-reductase
MHIAVIGAGSMGCLYGANLARAGAKVTLVDTWEEHVNRIAGDGLKMDGLRGSFTAALAAHTDLGSVAPADMAIVLVNAYDTQAAAQAAAVLLQRDGFVLTLQNGLGNVEVLEEVLGRGRVMAGLSFHSADLRGPGAVSHTNRGPTYLGELGGRRSTRLEAVETLMEQAGMEPEVEADIMATVWGKFVHNCAINAVCAATGLRPGHIRDIEELDLFQESIVAEALALAKALGVVLPDSDPLPKIKAYCAQKFHRVSMLQHLERGGRTEIDALNGYIVRQSQKLDIACPSNQALVALVKGLEYRPEGEHSTD